MSPFVFGLRFTRQWRRISRPELETIMAHILNLPQVSRSALDRINATLRAAARAVASEHERALHAANKAALPHRCAAAVRALYLPSDLQQESNTAEQAACRD
jgi:hypothetical protein